jgi:DNA-binding MarR family transcriptional regulator
VTVSARVPAEADADLVPVELGEQIFDLLTALVGRMHEHFSRAIAEFDLPPTQAKALLHLAEPLPMGVLAEILQCDASNITGVVDGLESRGLVERRVSTRDRRIKQLTLTRRGRVVRTRLHARLYERMPAVEKLAPRDRLVFRDLLQQGLADG